MSIIQLNFTRCDEIVNKVANLAEDLVDNKTKVDTGKMSSEMTDELCRIYQLFNELLNSYQELIMFDKQRILAAKNDFLDLDFNISQSLGMNKK